MSSVRTACPLAFLLTGGQAVAYKVGALLIERLPACGIVLADKGCGSYAIRKADRGGRCKPCFSPGLY